MPACRVKPARSIRAALLGALAFAAACGGGATASPTGAAGAAGKAGASGKAGSSGKAGAAGAAGAAGRAGAAGKAGGAAGASGAAGGGGAAGSSGAAGDGGGGLAQKALSVRGNQLVDATGKPVRLLGINRAGSEYMCATATVKSVFDGPTDDPNIEAMLSWHINTVRLPLNESCWLGIAGTDSDVGGDF